MANIISHLFSSLVVWRGNGGHTKKVWQKIQRKAKNTTCLIHVLHCKRALVCGGGGEVLFSNSLVGMWVKMS